MQGKLINYERQHESRWRDDYEEQRQMAVLFDLNREGECTSSQHCSLR